MSGKTRGFLYLSDAVLAFYGLPDEHQARATIKVWDGGRVYKAAEIRRFHEAPDGAGDVKASSHALIATAGRRA